MIAKHVPTKLIKKSNFSFLVKYITNAQQKNERVGDVTVTNCHSNRPDAAILEVLNTQAQNTRSESNKTYHLILSFRAGEQLDAGVLKAIEAHICEGLGYGQHQRVSAVHHDTDNLHIHLAINKIHPTRYTIHNPYNDHKTLGNLCENLERDYGLEHDNHQAQKRGAENRADDMERHSGIESLLGWIKRECLNQIQGVQSWAEMHQVMRDNGLEIREQGNGLVITDDAGTMVKASSVARELSKGKLESKFGAFETALERQAAETWKPARKHEARPARTRVDTVDLYAKYRAEQQDSGVGRTAEWAKTSDRKIQLIEAAKQTGRFKRAAIKLMSGPGVSRKLLYAITSKNLKNKIEKIKKQYLKDRQSIHEKYPLQAWADWLRRKATEGNNEALATLRAREASSGLKGNTVAANGGEKTAAVANVPQDSITKKGTIIYRVGASAIRDDGDNLKVSRGATQDGLEAALRMAMERYGDRITVNGTAEFKGQIARAAATANLPIIFADVALERHRQALLNETAARTDRGRANEVLSSVSAADKYIAEREQKRLKGFDIPNHIWYNDHDAGLAIFAGIRYVEGTPLALLKRGEKIVVLPVDAATERRMKRLSVGDPVTVTPKGSIKTKGRSR